MDTELRQNVRVLRKRYALIVFASIACVATSYVLTRLASPTYQAEAKLFVGQQQISSSDVVRGQTVTDLSAKLLESYASILQTHPIAALAAQQASLPQNPPKLAKEIVAEAIPDTQIIRLRYRSGDARLAQRTVNAIAKAFVSEVEKIERPSATRSEEPAVRVSIVEPALVPGEPVEPRPVRNYALGLVLGLLLGFGLAVLAEHLDRTIKDKDDLEESLGLPVLASIPKIQMRSDELHLEVDNQSVFAESFRKLRTAIQLYDAGTTHRTILITSAHAREGKSTTAINLAAVCAYAGSSTVLVEADLRRPKLHEHFTITELNGFTTALLGRITLDQATLRTSIPHLACIPAAAIPPNPVELLASGHMQAILEELKQHYETIVIDAPPLLPVADATTIASRVDGVLLVARTKQTRRDQLKESAELVKNVGGRVLGVVLNAVPMDLSDSAYSYYDVETKRRGRSFVRR